LLRVGFALPPLSLPGRCALALSRLSGRTFSPLPGLDFGKPEEKPGGIFSVALSVLEVYVRSRKIHLQPSRLASTLPCGVRTFLSPAPACQRQTLAGVARALERSSDRPACSRYQVV